MLMIDNFLRNVLPQEYGITGRSSINLSTITATGVFEKGDAVACVECRHVGRATCNENVMKVNAAQFEITIVEHENYLNQFNGRKIAEGGRCDLLLCDEAAHHKIVFCEMGCYSSNYFKNKRVKAHQQVTDSLKRLLKKPLGLNFVNLFCEKELVFFRRDPGVDTETVHQPVRTDARLNMQVFNTNPATMSTHVESYEEVNDMHVKFVIVNYPSVYNW